MVNPDFATTLDEVADRLRVPGANPFRVRACRTGARMVQAMRRTASILQIDLAPRAGRLVRRVLDSPAASLTCEEASSRQ